MLKVLNDVTFCDGPELVTGSSSAARWALTYHCRSQLFTDPLFTLYHLSISIYIYIYTHNNIYNIDVGRKLSSQIESTRTHTHIQLPPHLMVDFGYDWSTNCGMCFLPQTNEIESILHWNLFRLCLFASLPLLAWHSGEMFRLKDLERPWGFNIQGAETIQSIHIVHDSRTWFYSFACNSCKFCIWAHRSRTFIVDSMMWLLDRGKGPAMPIKRDTFCV